MGIGRIFAYCDIGHKMFKQYISSKLDVVVHLGLRVSALSVLK